MARTNIVIDDSLMRKAMRVTRLKTKKAAVEEALRFLIEIKGQTSIRKWRGQMQWEGNLAEMREARPS